MHRSLGDHAIAATADPNRLARSALGAAVGVGLLVAAVAVLLSRLLPLSDGHVAKALAAYALLLIPLFLYLHAHRPHGRFGAANGVTLFRGGIVCILAAFIGERWADAQWLVASAAIAALTLDGVDGWLARTTGSESRFGARFDMETDAMLVLVLSVLAWQGGPAGPWVLAAGLLRYGFVAAASVWRWLDRPLPPSGRRKTICVLQLIGLIACIAPALPDAARIASAAGAVLLVAGSFAIDVAWLTRSRHLPEPAG
jgi:phosphatidylglycerophosphate synthase